MDSFERILHADWKEQETFNNFLILFQSHINQFFGYGDGYLSVVQKGVNDLQSD